MKLFCRCSCIQSCLKSIATKSNTHNISYLINKSTLIIPKGILKGKAEVSILLQEGTCSACRLVQLHLVLLQIHCYEVQYSQYFIFHRQKFTNNTQTYLKGKTEVSILLQEGSCSACRLVKTSSLCLSCELNPSMMLTVLFETYTWSVSQIMVNYLNQHSFEYHSRFV